MENVVPVEQLGDLIAATVAQIQAGAAKARANGIVIDLPKEIQITAIVVAPDGFQALQLQGGETTEVTGTQGGTETRKSTEQQKQDSGSTRIGNDKTTDEQQTFAENAHNQASETFYTYEDQ